MKDEGLQPDPFFNSRGGDPEEETLEDLSVLNAFCEALYEDLGCGIVKINNARLWGVLAEIPPILSRNAATPNPSLFKRAAAFTIAFMHGCFHFLSLLYEALAYKSNPAASYPEVV